MKSAAMAPAVDGARYGMSSIPRPRREGMRMKARKPPPRLDNRPATTAPPFRQLWRQGLPPFFLNSSRDSLQCQQRQQATPAFFYLFARAAPIAAPSQSRLNPLHCQPAAAMAAGHPGPCSIFSATATPWQIVAMPSRRHELAAMAAGYPGPFLFFAARADIHPHLPLKARS